MRSSTIGERPAFIKSTLVELTSTPMTLKPSFAKQPQDTAPTYPSPNTLTRITQFCSFVKIMEAPWSKCTSRTVINARQYRL
jgi:hypothetical protein